ncbi:MAG TPA: isoprenylcysteine carboxylmethyltransferase family protein [Pyrinomonadaceae bacterium]|jgi:protein-S-isoprenylcysteine O-methyltransferase Ste14
MVSKNKRLLQRLRVPLGFLFAIIFLAFAKPAFSTLIAGAIVSIIGILIRAWASGHIRKNQNLAVSGPYAFTRNPLYLGSFLLGVGFTVASGVWWLALIFIVLFLGIYLPVMRVEAEDLAQIFGADFDEYKQNVPLFFPRLTPWKNSTEKFNFQLYLRYREYRAAFGLVAAWSVLAAKAYFFG